MALAMPLAGPVYSWASIKNSCKCIVQHAFQDVILFLHKCTTAFVCCAEGLILRHMLLQAVQPNQGCFVASLGAQGLAAIFKHTLLTTKASATSTICDTSERFTGLPQLVLYTQNVLS